MPTVRLFVPAEWRTYRELRLRSLADSPDAFGRTLAEEESRSDEEWAERLRAGCASGTECPLVAEVGAIPVGLAWGRFPNPSDLDNAFLFQMWVDPSFRRHGLGRRLLSAVTTWAQRSGARYLNLGVTCGTPAMRLYESEGFNAVGGPTPLRAESPLRGQMMRLRLRGDAAE